MVDSGTGFGLDLYQLDKVAKSDLPTVASVYGDAVGKCELARRAFDGMPAVPDQFTNGPNGSVYGSFGQLYDVVVELLKETGTNLNETAQSLHEAVELYAESDRAAAAELKRLYDQRGVPKPE